jgi:hypothetical protein
MARQRSLCRGHIGSGSIPAPARSSDARPTRSSAARQAVTAHATSFANQIVRRPAVPTPAASSSGQI